MARFEIPVPANQYIPQRLNLFKAVLFPALILCGFILSDYIAKEFDHHQPTGQVAAYWVILKWTVIGIIAVVNTALLAGMGILAHDGVHRVLLKNKIINDVFSSLLSIHSLLPFYANRQFHLNHHSFAHQPGKDPEEVIHNRPYFLALLMGPFFGLAAQYQILIRNMLGMMDRKKCFRAIADLLSVGIAGLSYFYWLPKTGVELKNTVVPLLAVLPVVYNYRAISDHYGLPAVIRKSQRTDLSEEGENNTLQEETSGWIVKTTPLLQWFWSNVNYHEVHHKFPYLSYHHLPAVYEETRESLPYEVVNGYTRSLINLRKRRYYQD